MAGEVAGGVAAGIAQAVIKSCANLVQGFHATGVNREDATKALVDHFRSQYPKFNVMVVHPSHVQSFQESVHTHIEINTGIFGTTGYEVYVFKCGSFTLLGDSGYINWAFGGSFERVPKPDVKQVIFYDIP